MGLILGVAFMLSGVLAGLVWLVVLIALLAGDLRLAGHALLAAVSLTAGHFSIYFARSTRRAARR